MPSFRVPPANFRWLLAFALATRLVVLGAGSLLSYTPPVESSAVARAEDAALPAPPAEWVGAWYRFDALNYLKIALRGYTVGEPKLLGFLPALPLSMRALSASGLAIYLAGLLIPNVAFVLGLALFGRAIAEESRDDGIAWRACALLVAAPTAFFYSAPYQESLGFLCVAGALYAWLRRAPLCSGVSIAVASIARQTGIMFAGAVVVEWVADLIARRQPRHSAWMVVCLSPVGFVMFGWYVNALVSDPTILVDIQAKWGRRPPGVGNLLAVFAEGFQHPNFDHLTLFLFVALGIFAWYKAGPFWGALVLLPLALAASTGTEMSMKRQVLACFPVCYPLAMVLHARWSFFSVLFLESALQTVFLWRYVHGQWVG